jgi:hypothetical protein
LDRGKPSGAFVFWKGGKMEKNMSAFYKGEDAEKTATSATKDKEASIFENHRFWEYVAQIKIDGHDPADILEPWMKKHHPEYFEEEAVTWNKSTHGIGAAGWKGRPWSLPVD